MRSVALLGAAGLLLFGMAVAQQTPPGPDTLGSRPEVTPPQPPNASPNNPTRNQDTTGTNGSTTGNNRNPDFAGGPPNPARGVQGHNPSSTERGKTAHPRHKNKKSRSKQGATTKKGVTPPAANPVPPVSEPPEDEMMMPRTRAIVLIKA